MKRNFFTLAATLTVTAACGRELSAPVRSDVETPRSISVTSSTFSLLASRDTDGRVTGQWTDELAEGAAITVDVTCMRIVDDLVMVGGVIRESQRRDLLGLEVFANVRSTGETSYTILGTGASCGKAPQVPLQLARGTRITLH